MAQSDRNRKLGLQKLGDLPREQCKDLGPALSWLSHARQQGLAVLSAAFVGKADLQSERLEPILLAHSTRLQAKMFLRIFAREAVLAEKAVLGLSEALDFINASQKQYDEQIDALLIERLQTVSMSGEIYLRSPRGVGEQVLYVRSWTAVPSEPTTKSEQDQFKQITVDLNADDADLQSAPLGLSVFSWRRLLKHWGLAQQLFGDDIVLSWQVLDGQVFVRALWPHSRRQDIKRLGAQVSGIELWSSFILREDLAYSLSPLSLDIWQHSLLPVVFETLTGLPGKATRERRMLPVDLVSGRFYWSINRLLATPSGRLMLGLAARLDPAAWPNLRGAMQQLDLQTPPLAGLRKLWTTTKSLRALLRLIAEALRGLHGRRSLQDWKKLGREILNNGSQDLSILKDTELLAGIESNTDAARELLRRGLAHELLAAGLIHLGQFFWPRSDAQSYERLERSQPAGPSADLLRRCRSLLGLSAEQLQADPRWADLLKEHGHRSVRELDLAAPRWSEDDQFLQQCILRGDPAKSAQPTELVKRAESRSWLQSWLCALWPAVQLREWPRWVFSAQLAVLRKQYLELSRRLVQRNILLNPQQVWFAQRELLTDLLLGRRHDHEAIVAQQLQPAARDWAEKVYNKAPVVLSADGCEWMAESDSSGAQSAIFQGAASSAGCVHGRARVVLQPGRDIIQAGEILVVPTLTASMAALLTSARALVSEVGDLASVAAMMARSQGIPAVTGVVLATQRIVDGALIEVDGNRGIVRIIDNNR